jgi:hypothetical protein
LHVGRVVVENRFVGGERTGSVAQNSDVLDARITKVGGLDVVEMREWRILGIAE